MKDPQEVFNELQRVKSRQKSIRKEYRELLAQDRAYQSAKEEYDASRKKKKLAEQAVQEQMGPAYAELDELKAERAALEEMLSDIAVSAVSKGENITIVDADHNEYVPCYKVSFKKID